MLRRPDAEVEQLLKTFTFLNLSEISTVMDKHQAAPEKRYAQERLAESLTLLLHGEQGLLTAQRSTAIIYKGDMKQLSSLNVDEARSLFQQADYIQKLYSPGINVLGRKSEVAIQKREILKEKKKKQAFGKEKKEIKNNAILTKKKRKRTRA